MDWWTCQKTAVCSRSPQVLTGVENAAWARLFNIDYRSSRLYHHRRIIVINCFQLTISSNFQLTTYDAQWLTQQWMTIRPLITRPSLINVPKVTHLPSSWCRMQRFFWMTRSDCASCMRATAICLILSMHLVPAFLALRTVSSTRTQAKMRQRWTRRWRTRMTRRRRGVVSFTIYSYDSYIYIYIYNIFLISYDIVSGMVRLNFMWKVQVVLVIVIVIMIETRYTSWNTAVEDIHSP